MSGGDSRGSFVLGPNGHERIFDEGAKLRTGLRGLLGEIAKSLPDVEESAGRREAENLRVAAPGPVFGSSAHRCSHRIHGDVAMNLPEMSLTDDKDAVVSGTEYVPFLFARAINPLGVACIEELHAGCDICGGGFDE
jgi:hypothetical protein